MTVPVPGDIRFVEEFLWIPMQINGKWKWLKFVSYLQRFDRMFEWQTYQWHTVKWVEKQQ